MFWLMMLQAPTPVRQEAAQADTLAALRRYVAGLERRGTTRADAAHLPFGDAAVDGVLPGGGLQLGALHEVAGAGPDIEHGASAASFVAGVLARLSGPVLWVLERSDLFAPGLAMAGLHPDRVVYVAAGQPAAVLTVMEEGLRERGMAAVVGEVGGRMSLTATRRLQLAAEGSGAIAFALRRSRRHDDPALDEPSAAVTRWRVHVRPSGPALPHAPGVPGLARARWQLDLMRCRGGQAGSWMAEACDAQGRLGVVADLEHRQAAPQRRLARA